MSNVISNIINIDDLLTPEDASKILGVTSKTLATWRSTKRYPIQYIKIGKVIRYRKSDLELYLSTCMQNTGEVA